MNHLEFAQLESEALREHPWDRWIKKAEMLLGHDLDGNQKTDGYSLDYAYVWFCSGRSPQEYADMVKKARQ